MNDTGLRKTRTPRDKRDKRSDKDRNGHATNVFIPAIAKKEIERRLRYYEKVRDG